MKTTIQYSILDGSLVGQFFRGARQVGKTISIPLTEERETGVRSGHYSRDDIEGWLLDERERIQKDDTEYVKSILVGWLASNKSNN
jgi:hypothetical protein